MKVTAERSRPTQPRRLLQYPSMSEGTWSLEPDMCDDRNVQVGTDTRLESIHSSYRQSELEKLISLRTQISTSTALKLLYSDEATNSTDENDKHRRNNIKQVG